MTREEVILGLECCLAVTKCGVCPYNTKDDLWCGNNSLLMEDALALLKEQDPVAPVLQSGGNYVCGNCGMYTVGYMHPLTGESVQTWKYCAKCGKKVRWDA